MSVERIRLSPDLKALFASIPQIENVQATITNNIEYIMALEYGHSAQAPDGMVRTYMTEYDGMLDANMRNALQTYPNDPMKAARVGVSLGALEILRAIADRTPVDTGRAKGAWTVTLPGQIASNSGGQIIRSRMAGTDPSI